jgi:hypothetical protein
MTRISEETDIHVAALYVWRKGWRLEGEVVLASQKDPEGWGATAKYTVVLETASFNATEISAYCRDRGLYPGAVQPLAPGSPYQAMASVPEALNANAKPVRTMAEQKDLENSTLRIKGRSRLSKRSCSARRRPWRRRRHCWCCEKSGRPAARRTRKADECRPAADGDRADRRGECRWRQTGSRLL